METETQPCPRCGARMAWTLGACSACGSDLRVDVRLAEPVADSKRRYELARRLTGQAGVHANVAVHLKERAPLIAQRVTRATAAALGRALAEAGLAFDVEATSRRASPTRPLTLVAVGVAIVVGAGGWIVALRSRAAPPSPPAASATPPPPQPVAAVAPAAAPTVAEPPSKRALKDAVRSVVSVRCPGSMGSGFFLKPGTVVTNQHVLCADDVAPKVVLSTGAELEASVVARDARHDLALLAVASDTPALELADAAQAGAGEPVSIIGSPKGLEFSVQRATLAFVGRPVGGVGYLQIDGAVNPGNSGGPLLDEHGRVLGVVVAKLLNADGIGFAVPANYLVVGPDALWADGPSGLRSEAWRALDEVAQKAVGNGLTGASAEPTKGPFHMLLAATWLDTRHDGSLPDVLAAIVSTDPTADERRWTFQLMASGQPLCDVLPTRKHSWAALDEKAPGPIGAAARELAARAPGAKLFTGTMTLQWGACPGVAGHPVDTFDLELPIGATGSKRVPVLYRREYDDVY